MWYGRAAVLGVGAMVAALSGCSASSIAGRVLPGPAAVVTLVDDNDSRLSTPGVEGVEVEIKAVGRAGDAHLIGSTTTDADGSFSISVDDRALIKNSMILTARSNGITAVREPVQYPGDGRRVLVLIPQLARTKGSQ